MQKLSLVVLAALGAAFASIGPAAAQARNQAPDCPAREVSLYFERDKAELNSFSKVLVDKVVTEAKSCGARQILAEAQADPAHAHAISDAFESRGLKVVMAASPRTSAAPSEAMAARATSVRLTLNNKIG